MPAASPIIHICAPHKGIVTLPPAAQNGGSRSLPVATSGDRFAGTLGRRPGCLPGMGCWLPRCPCEEGGDDVGRVPVQAGPGPVVAHGGARVGMGGGGLLHVPQRHPGIESSRDELVPTRAPRRAATASAPELTYLPADTGTPGQPVSPSRPGTRERRTSSAPSPSSVMMSPAGRACRSRPTT
jgi:hypothetical protein